MPLLRFVSTEWALHDIRERGGIWFWIGIGSRNYAVEDGGRRLDKCAGRRYDSDTQVPTSLLQRGTRGYMAVWWDCWVTANLNKLQWARNNQAGPGCRRVFEVWRRWRAAMIAVLRGGGRSSRCLMLQATASPSWMSVAAYRPVRH